MRRFLTWVLATGLAAPSLQADDVFFLGNGTSYVRTTPWREHNQRGVRFEACTVTDAARRMASCETIADFSELALKDLRHCSRFKEWLGYGEGAAGLTLLFVTFTSGGLLSAITGVGGVAVGGKGVQDVRNENANQRVLDTTADLLEDRDHVAQGMDFEEFKRRIREFVTRSTEECRMRTPRIAQNGHKREVRMSPEEVLHLKDKGSASPGN